MMYGERPEPLNEWNTRFPANLGHMTFVADDLGAQGFDVSTVTITLDNGSWIAEFLSTDEDMQEHVHEFEVASSGYFERV